VRVYGPRAVFNPATAVAPVVFAQANNNIAGQISATPSFAAPLFIATTSVNDAVSGQPYTTTFSAIGGKLPYTWSATPGAIDANGVFSNTFGTSDGPQQITVTVTDFAGQKFTKVFAVNVYQTLKITTFSLPSGTVNQPYSATLAGAGGKTPYNWSLYKPAALPAGLTLSSTTGQISGTPAATSGDLTFQVTDSAHPSQTMLANLYFTAVNAAVGCGPTVTAFFNNSNSSGVSNGGTAPTFSTNGQSYCLDSIWTYHWNGGTGTTPGTIGLTAVCDVSCAVIGPYQAVGSSGQNGAPNVNWTARPPSDTAVVLNGSYTVNDSSPVTWSQNQQSQGTGFTIVYVRSYTPPTHTAVAHLKYNDLPLTPSGQPDMFAVNTGTGVYLDSTQIVWNHDDTVTVSGLPDGHYVLEVASKESAPAKYFPGGFWAQVGFQVAGANVDANVIETRLIHVTQPADNATTFNGFACPPNLSVTPTQIAWDAMEIANVTYTYSVQKVQCATGAGVVITSGSTTATSVPLTLTSSVSGEYYTIHLDAYSTTQTHVGQIMSVGSNWYGWDVRFTVP
jgi:hypothetical protein